MDEQQKRSIKRFLYVLISIAFLYIVFATNSRYGDLAGGGAIGSVVDYLGQPFPNFCYFFDTFKFPWTSNAIIFSTTYQFLYPDEIYGGVPLQEELTSISGIFTAVFYTFLGHIMTIGGKSLLYEFCGLYFIASYFVLKNVFKKTYTIKSIYIYQGLSSIMVYGLFGYYYASPLLDLSVISTYIIISHLFRIKK